MATEPPQRGKRSIVCGPCKGTGRRGNIICALCRGKGKLHVTWADGATAAKAKRDA